jgi:hypothetical protein
LRSWSSCSTCTASGKDFIFNFDFPAVANGVPVPYRNVKLYFTSGQLSRGDFDYGDIPDQGRRKEIIVYDEVRTELRKGELEGDALSKVLSGEKLRPEFSSYELNDLRQQQ